MFRCDPALLRMEWRGKDQCRTRLGWSGCVKPKKKPSGEFRVERFMAEAVVLLRRVRKGCCCSCYSHC